MNNKEYRNRVVTTVSIVGLMVFFAALFVQLKDLFLIGFLSLILAIFIKSISLFFQTKFKIKLKFANALGIFVLLCLVLLPFLLISTPFTSQTQSFMNSLPSTFSVLETYLTDNLSNFGFSFDHFSLTSFFQTLTNSLQSLVTGAFTAVGVGFDFLAKAILTFFIAGFIAVAPSEYKNALKDFFPKATRKFMSSFGYDLTDQLKHWIIGMFLAMLFVGSLATFGYWVIGIKYFIVFGVISGLFEIIPYFGPTLAVIFPVVFSLTQDPSKAIPVLIIFLTIQFVENYFFLPFLWKKQVNVPPAISIFAILLFSQLLGFLGILLAIPIFLVVRTFSLHILEWHNETASTIPSNTKIKNDVKKSIVNSKKG
ncbi:MAG: AI-2E family transporter [Caldisericia bacterium]|nr:AI-2E family transporter [Caldisericia bacterium]